MEQKGSNSILVCMLPNPEKLVLITGFYKKCSEFIFEKIVNINISQVKNSIGIRQSKIKIYPFIMKAIHSVKHLLLNLKQLPILFLNLFGVKFILSGVQPHVF